MSKSGKEMDFFTKEIQKIENKNSRISYKKSDDGYKAIITSGGNEYISRVLKTKDDARQEAITLASESLSFLYNN